MIVVVLLLMYVCHNFSFIKKLATFAALFLPLKFDLSTPRTVLIVARLSIQSNLFSFWKKSYVVTFSVLPSLAAWLLRIRHACLQEELL